MPRRAAGYGPGCGRTSHDLARCRPLRGDFGQLWPGLVRHVPRLDEVQADVDRVGPRVCLLGREGTGDFDRPWPDTADHFWAMSTVAALRAVFWQPCGLTWPISASFRPLPASGIGLGLRAPEGGAVAGLAYPHLSHCQGATGNRMGRAPRSRRARCLG